VEEIERGSMAKRKPTMSRSGRSYFIESTGADEPALVKGFNWLLAEAKVSGNRGLIAVSQKSNLDNIARWSSFAPVLLQLKKQGTANFSTVTLQLFTLGNHSVYNWSGPILVVYGGQKLLDAVDSIEGSVSVLYIPWLENEYADWVTTRNAIPWMSTGNAKPQMKRRAEAMELTSGVVLVALQRLTEGVNLNTGISHGSDYTRTVKYLETLFRKNADVTPELIFRHLMTLRDAEGRGWRSEDATEVKNLAEKIWAGKSVKESTGVADERIWAYWLGLVERS
jgi:hypothetical protein